MAPALRRGAGRGRPSAQQVGEGDRKHGRNSVASFLHFVRAVALGIVGFAVAVDTSARAAAPQLADANAPRPKSAAGAESVLEAVVFRAYAESDGYSSIERDVGPSHRKAIEQRLPFKVHFNELGEHSLLVAFRGRRPVGLVYQRTEESDWGLVDIAWHVSLDLRVYGFEITRGLGRDAKEIADSVFAEQLAGSTFDEVCARLAVHQEAMRAADPSPRDLLTRTVLRSAAKALAVTAAVWSHEVEKLHDQAEGFDLFPAAARFVRRTTKLDVEGPEGRRSFDAKVMYAYDFGNTLLGYVIWSKPREATGDVHLRWVVDRERRVIVVRPDGVVRDTSDVEAWSRMSGRLLAAPGDVEPALASLAQGLGALAVRLERRGRL